MKDRLNKVQRFRIRNKLADQEVEVLTEQTMEAVGEYMETARPDEIDVNNVIRLKHQLDLQLRHLERKWGWTEEQFQDIEDAILKQKREEI